MHGQKNIKLCVRLYISETEIEVIGWCGRNSPPHVSFCK